MFPNVTWLRLSTAESSFIMKQHTWGPGEALGWGPSTLRPDIFHGSGPPGKRQGSAFSGEWACRARDVYVNTSPHPWSLIGLSSCK